MWNWWWPTAPATQVVPVTPVKISVAPVVQVIPVNPSVTLAKPSEAQVKLSVTPVKLSEAQVTALNSAGELTAVDEIEEISEQCAEAARIVRNFMTKKDFCYTADGDVL